MGSTQPSPPIHEDGELCRYILGNIDAHPGSLAIRESNIPGAGTGIFTTRDVAEGELIFVSSPLLHCAETRDPFRVCDFCYQARRDILHPDGRFLVKNETLPDPLACSGCLMYRYCSKPCQTAAWKAYHKYECELLSNASAEVEIRALCRLLIKIKHEKVSKQQVEVLSKLQNHHDKYRQGENESEGEGENKNDVQYRTIQQVAVEAKARTGSDLALVDVEKLYCMLLINCAPMEQTYRNKNLGIALDLALSLVNHSCDPNLVVVFNNEKLHVRALRALSAGEELLHCYREVVAFDLMLRQPRLKTRYLFQCECARCKAEAEQHFQAVSADASRLKSIQQSQLKFLEIMTRGMENSIMSFENLNVTQLVVSIHDLIEDGYAGSKWPDDLEPLPTTWKTLAVLCNAKGQTIVGLKLRLRGCASTKQRQGLAWVEDLLDLVKALAAIAALPPHHSVFRDNVGIPKSKEMRDIFMGHLQELLNHSTKTHGPEAVLTRAIQKWFDDEVPDYYGPRPNTRNFRRKFKASHASLLKWAGVNEKLWAVKSG